MKPTRGAAWCLLLSLIGSSLSGYLYYLHLGLLRGELLGGAACGAAGSAFNCHAVTAGPWGQFLGIPLALWGLVGYVAVLALSLLGRQADGAGEHAVTLIFLLAVVFVGIDLVLFAHMAFVIRLYCLFCLLTYAINLSLLAVSARSLAFPWPRAAGQLGGALRALAPSPRRPGTDLFWGILLVGILAIAGMHTATVFVSRGTLSNFRSQMRDFATRQPRVSVDVTGDPAVGPADAPLLVAEFSDFLCPVCQRASRLNAIMLANHRRDVRFVFKHYPLDMSCNDKVPRVVHAGACQVAAASECAHLQGRFWAFHDLVFEKGHAYEVSGIERDAARIGLDLTRFKACMESGQGMEAVKRDVAEGAKIGVSSTPTYVVNGLPMNGLINPSVFEDLVEVLRENR